MGRSVIACLAFTALLSAPAAGAEWFVKAGGAGDGQAADKPAGDLAAILALCRRGDLVKVAGGEYHGRGGSGEFCVSVPNLTICGGWNDAFTERKPFEHFTVLRRAPDAKGFNYTNTMGGIICTPPDAHGEGKITSCSGLIIDGFVIDGSTRNSYNNTNSLQAQGSWKEGLIKLTSATAFSTANIKIRNCILFNAFNTAVEIKWMGDQNEVTNCLIFNNTIGAIDLRAMQAAFKGPQAVKDFPATQVAVRNNTLAFNWDHDKAAMGCGILLTGHDGKAVIENNVLAFLTGVTRAALHGLSPSDVVKGNVLWVTGDGEALVKAQTTAAQTGGGRRDEEEEEGGGAAPSANVADNVVADPGFDARVDKDWLTCFTGFGVKFSKARPEELNPARAKHGLPPVEGPSVALPPTEQSYMKKYPANDLAGLVKAFACDVAGKGFRADAPLETYASREGPEPLGALGGKSGEYREIQFADLEKGAANAPKEGEKVKLKVNLRELANRWQGHHPAVQGLDYMHFEVGKPGVTGNTPFKMFAYAVRGSQAGNRYNEFGSSGARAQTKDGIWVRGMVFPTGNPANNQVPWVMIVDYVGAPGAN